MDLSNGAIIQAKNESEIKVQNHLVKNVPGNASDKLIDNDEEPMELSNVPI
jgi:hypothetical protein